MKFFPERLSIEWLRDSYKSGYVTPLEVAKEIVKRAEEHKDSNIFIVPPSFETMREYIDRLPEYTEDMPLWGIPFAIKDNIDLCGVPTTAACEAYEYKPEKNATVVDKLIKAGAIPVGKTNLDQFATGLVGTRSPYGEVHNAYREELISGGSSSGSAVAVALGISSFSLGTDTAGSGRVPAALNCLVGYKPSVGAWSATGVVPACASLDCVTVFAGNLKDAQEVNLIARGVDREYAYSREIQMKSSRLPSKICLPSCELTFYGPYRDEYRAKWNRAVERIKRLGIEVEYIDYSMFQKAASILYDGPWVAERWRDLGEFVENNKDKVFPVTEKILSSGNDIKNTAASVFGAMHELAEYKSRVSKILEDAVLIMPTAGGTYTRDEVRANPIETNSNMGLYTNHCNLLDLCAIAVPEDESDRELPFGITIFALADSENLMMGMAQRFLEMRTMTLAVCGLHKKGYPLEYQLREIGAYYTESVKTAEKYRLYRLPISPEKPGMCQSRDGGSIEVDLYEIPVSTMGYFMEKVKQPLAIGEIELEDGRIVKGFICEEYITSCAEDITKIGKYELI